jgi:hypothetical protein
MAEDPYVYPGTHVLRNRQDIRDPAELDRRERDSTNLRLLQLATQPLPGPYDLQHLKAFHRHIFGDLYPWAGEIRTVAIAKGDLFALPQHIEPYLTSVLAQLPAENHLQASHPNSSPAGSRTTWPRSTASTRSGRATAAPSARSSANLHNKPATASPGRALTPSATSRSPAPHTTAKSSRSAPRWAS